MLATSRWQHALTWRDGRCAPHGAQGGAPSRPVSAGPRHSLRFAQAAKTPDDPHQSGPATTGAAAQAQTAAAPPDAPPAAAASPAAARTTLIVAWWGPERLHTAAPAPPLELRRVRRAREGHAAGEGGRGGTSQVMGGRGSSTGSGSGSDVPDSQGGRSGSGDSSSGEEVSSGESSTSTGGSSDSNESDVEGNAGQEEEECQQEGLRHGERGAWEWQWRPAGPLRPGMIPPPSCPAGSRPAVPNSPPPHDIAPAAAISPAAAPPTWRQVFAGLSVEGPGKGEAGAVEESRNSSHSSRSGSSSVWAVPATISPAWVRVAAPPPPRAEAAGRAGEGEARVNGVAVGGQEEEAWALGRSAVRGMARALGAGAGDGGALEAACAGFWRLDSDGGFASTAGTAGRAGRGTAAGGSEAGGSDVRAQGYCSGVAAGGASGRVGEAAEEREVLSGVLAALQLPELRLFLRDEQHVARMYLPPAAEAAAAATATAAETGEAAGRD